jgi:trimeric autotransporter adhesin
MIAPARVSFVAFPLAVVTAFAPAQCTTPWSALGAGANQYVDALAVLPNGDLVVGGTFTSAGGVPAACIARWDGQSWLPLGAGVSGSSGPPTSTAVHCLLVLPNGDLIVGGNFNQAGGVPAAAVARWDGNAWSSLGSTAVGMVRALARLANGDLVVGGSWVMFGSNPQHLARWDGTTWHPLGIGVNTYEVKALATLPNGDLVAGGNFWTAGGMPANYIARWNGSTWSQLGSGLGGGVFGTWVNTLCTLPNGDLIVGGNFTTAGGLPANRIARWNGSSWSSFGSGIGSTGLMPLVYAITTLADGDLVVGGSFTSAGGVAANSIARWRGGVWTPMGAGMDNTVDVLLALANGDLIAGGAFTAVDGGAASRVARRTTTCAAGATLLGAGCVGATAQVSLTATRLPWLGGTFEARASGLQPGSLAVGVFGFTPLAVPMPSVHPLGAAGCMLWVDDDILVQFALGSGVVDTAIAIPAVPVLVGGVFHHQVVPVELDAAGELVALTASNALTLTIGML